VRWISWVALTAASVARADPPKPDPDLFGDSRPAPPPSCDDGRDFGCARATNPFVAMAPYALSQWLSSDYLLRLPVADSTHDQVAQFAAGASRDEAGPSFGGATGLENRWTIDGAPADDIKTGGAGTRLPLIFLDGILVTAGGFSARDRTSTAAPTSRSASSRAAPSAISSAAPRGMRPASHRISHAPASTGAPRPSSTRTTTALPMASPVSSIPRPSRPIAATCCRISSR